MTHMFLDHLDNAYQSLKSNRTRSLLTTLGMTIGIASVTCILAIGNGVSAMINQQITTFNGNLVLVRPVVQSHDPNLYTSSIARQSFSTSTLTEADVTALRATAHVTAVAPLMTISSNLSAGKDSVQGCVVLATTSDFAQTTAFTMKAGQFLAPDSGVGVAVVGEQLAINLFGTEKPIGEQFTARGQIFTVSGVIKKDTNAMNYNAVDLNNAAIITFASGKQLHNSAQIQQINVLVDASATLAATTATINTTLQTQHIGEQDFVVTSGKEIAQPSDRLFKSITEVMTAIAAISLFVGGIGIMNIMLVGVAERTREIGIRKAVGASNGTIVSQFLIESLMISLLGGLLGYIMGYILAFAVSTFLYFAPSFTWSAFGIALGMAVVVGIIFGLYPAIMASRKDTIQSLRQYH